MVVLNFSLSLVIYPDVEWTRNINNQALLFYLIQYHNVRLVVFNLVDSLYFEVPLQLFVSGLMHWLWLMIVIFFIPVVTPAFHIVPSESPAPYCRASNMDIAFEQVSLHSVTV